MTDATCRKCGKRAWANGLCRGHNYWLSRNGTPEERFWAKVDKNGPVPEHRPELGRCWVWTAATHEFGYGVFTDGGFVNAHRWAYEHFVSPIPKGLELDHLCRNPPCVRPTHLDPVTSFVNQHRSPVTFASINSSKAYCPQGHEYTPENTRIMTSGSRECKECRRETVRRYRARQRAKRPPVETLTPAQEAELRTLMASGRARALRQAAGMSLADAGQELALRSGKVQVSRWELGKAFPHGISAVRYYEFLAGLSRSAAA